MSIKILALESSCDDTSAAIVTDKKEILSNIVVSQLEEHQPYQGVVPEIAARAHMHNMSYAINKALNEASVTYEHIDAIAATTGPGLIGGVIVGTMYGKALSLALKKPFISVNHLEGHALTARLTSNINYPYLLLLVSGGHCQFIAVQALGQYSILGKTLDDSVGEAFDKLAKMLKLGYPGGPIIEQRAKLGNENKYTLPLSMTDRSGCDMSFSGLKTAVRKVIQEQSEITEEFTNDICASFQYTIGKILKSRMHNAVEIFKTTYHSKDFVLSGGVAANQYIREILSNHLQQQQFHLTAPPIKLCTDNAAMIGWAAIERYKAGFFDPLTTCPQARWSLESLDEK